MTSDPKDSETPERPAAPVEAETLELEFTEIYRCPNLQEAQIIERLLTDSGIPTLIRDQRSTAFPTNIGNTAEKRLAVESDKTQAARKLIEEAVHDGVISDAGFSFEA